MGMHDAFKKAGIEARGASAGGALLILLVLYCAGEVMHCAIGARRLTRHLGNTCGAVSHQAGEAGRRCRPRTVPWSPR